MPIFTYTAKDYQGSSHKGDVETSDVKSAASILRKKKLIILSLRIKDDRNKQLYDKFFNRVPFADVVVTTRQLATMIGSGLVLSEAIDILSEEQTNKKLKSILEKISSDIKGGIDFGSALEKHEDVFPKLYVNLVKAGEASGKLDVILVELANHLEKEKEFRSKVSGAMIYPVMVISMMTIVMLIMVFFVMPKLLSLYSQSNIELPLPTKILIGGSTFILTYWWAILIVVVVSTLSIRYWIKTPKGAIWLDSHLIKLPIFGRIITVIIMTNFTRTFGLLIAAGIPILESIKISEEIVDNLAYRQALETSYTGVERGLPFSAQILAQPMFPKIVGQMIKTGEETGKLDEVITKLSNYFESEADNSLKNITTLIEPLILIVLGLGVALLVLSIILPIYKLTSSIG